MKVTNYTEWKQAVVAEHKKLAEVSYYLNENGKERMAVFDTMSGLANYCDTPEELLAWFDSKEDLNKYEVAYLESGHAAPAISALRKIVKTTPVELVPMPGTEGNWGEKHWGGK